MWNAITVNTFNHTLAQLLSTILYCTYNVHTSNGKSSIVEERLYSFFFALLKKKRSFVFFRFSSSSQLLTKMFALLRSGKILKGFTSLRFVFANFRNTPICFTSNFKSVGLTLFASLCFSKNL